MRAAIAHASEARLNTAAIRTQTDELIAEIQVATDGSSDDRPAEAIVRLQQAQVRLDEALAEFDAGTAAVEEYITNGLGGHVEASSEPTSRPAMAETHAHQPIPPAVSRLAMRLTFWQRGEPTRGHAWLDEDGEPVEFKSGRDNSASEGLRAEFAARVVTTDHVEGKLAARMRQPGGPVNVTAVINKTPCAGPIGCDETLPHIIPRDSAVTLYVRDASGVRHYRTYHGTGRGLA